MKKGRYIFCVFAGMCFFLIAGSDCIAQVTIDTSGFITVKPGTEMHIGGELKIMSGQKNSGHLCDQTDGTNVAITGNVTIQRHLTANMWHNCAVPVSNNASGVYAGTDLVFYYDETIIENDWEFGWVLYQGQLDVMKGYDVYMDVPATVNYTAPSSAELNTGSYSIFVTKTDPANGEIESHKGWNLIGNPYPSPVDWLDEAGWDKLPINDAKYIWDHQNQNYTIFLGGDDPLGINGGTRYIPANQGFWVQAVANGTVHVNNIARRGIMEDTPGFYKSAVDYPMICLRMEANGRYDETVIRFLGAATEGFDPGMDAFTFSGRAAGYPGISTLFKGDRLAVNSLPAVRQNMVFQLYTETGSGLPATLEMTPESTIGEYAEVYISDTYTNHTFSLNNGAPYHFTGVPENGNQRFVLYINPPEDIKNSITADNAYSIYSSGKVVYVTKNTSVPQEGTISIFDIYGNVTALIRLPDQEQFQFDTGLPPGYYIVRVVTEKFRIAEKLRIG